jgi:hypothetical protein
VSKFREVILSSSQNSVRKTLVSIFNFFLFGYFFSVVKVGGRKANQNSERVRRANLPPNDLLIIASTEEDFRV